MEAIRIEMAKSDLATFEEIANKLNMTRQTMSAISVKRQYPTTQHGIDLCRTFGYSANWLFLGKGESRLEHQATLNEILLLVQKK